MTITAEDMKGIALAIAAANGHPDPDEYADKAVAAFTGEPVPAPAAEPQNESL